MEVKILIKTAKGYANKVESKLRFFLMGKQKIKDLYVSEEDDQIVWVIDDIPRKIIDIQQKVNMYDAVIHNIFEQKLISKLLNKKDMPELKKMLLEHTKVEIVRMSEQEAIIEPGVTWWQKVRNTFKRGE